MNIAIFGSCVSRDTCELMSDVNVLEYVARQSVTSMISPHGKDGVDINRLNSDFQRRMVLSDLQGSGASRVVAHAKELDLILIDLVDERRGYWRFPDFTTMTNSLEVESCGAAEWAIDQGADLIEFGTDPHYEAWEHGFDRLVDQLKTAEVWDRAVLLDIEWARAFAGSSHPSNEMLATMGRRWRRTQRGFRDATRRLSQGDGIPAAWARLRKVKPTEAEEFAYRAAQANDAYRRYREHARSQVAATISRESSELRISAEHKWGPQPFHYRDSDYKSIVGSIEILMGRCRAAGGSQSVEEL